MKRKTSSIPTRVYSYGCLAPVSDSEQIDDQLRRAHRYRNALVEIEHRRRERIKAAQSAHNTLGPLLQVIDHIETQISDARKAAKLTRTGRDNPAERARLRDMIASLIFDLAILRGLRSWTKTRLREDEILQSAYRSIDISARIEIKAIRNDKDVAPYWGTYLIVEKTSETWRKSADAPRFLRYDGEGRLAVQIQKGMTVEDVMRGDDSRLRIMAATPRITKRGPRAGETIIKDTYRTVWIRVGSNGRNPIWAKLPFVMHRPLPEDGRIMWAWIQRRRRGVRWRWDIQFVVEARSIESVVAASSPENERTIAIDIGTRDLPSEGAVRVALWVNNANGGGELRLPITRLSSPTSHGKNRRRIVPDDLGKIEDIQSIRSKLLDDVKAALTICRVRIGHKIRTDYELTKNESWWFERTKGLIYWRSPARIGGLVREWRQHRFSNDSESLEEVIRYLTKDRHLLDWETRERERHFARRREYYRRYAAWVARNHGTIVLAHRDYRREEWVPEAAEASRAHESRVFMRAAAPGELSEIVKSVAKTMGRKVVEIKLEGDTAWALDARVCLQLLASDEAVNAPARPLAGVKKQNHYGTTESFKRRRLGTDEKLDPLANQDVTP